jgi:hypothetical protein
MAHGAASDLEPAFASDNIWTTRGETSTAVELSFTQIGRSKIATCTTYNVVSQHARSGDTPA